MFEIFYRRNRMPTARVLKATENAYNKRRMKLLGEIEKLLLGTGAADVTRVQYTVIDGKGGYFQNVKRLKEFSSERIVFQGKSGCVAVEGKGLSLGKYFGGDAAVIGDIARVAREE